MEQWEITSATDGIKEKPARYRTNFNGSEWDHVTDETLAELQPECICPDLPQGFYQLPVNAQE